jgi:menaquinone-dependent protoporphyrinogen oxidase
MRTLIIYASTYGYTHEMVNKMIKESNQHFDSINIVENQNIDIEHYDALILGSSIYVGQINKALKKFILENEALIMSKKLGIFLACGFEDQFNAHISNNFSAELIHHASTVINLGGAIEKDKLKFGHKILVNMVEKTEEGKKPINAYPNRTLEIVNHFNRA